MQKDDYYPFGLTFNHWNSTIPENQYKFNGNEVQPEIPNVADFNARFYDASLGRFMSIDPHAERYLEHTPYNYAFQNPILFIDPTGMDGTIYFHVVVSGRDSEDKDIIDAVNKGVEMINNTMKELGVDLKAEAHFGTSDDLMSRDEFYSREGAHESDSYVVVGDAYDLGSFAKKSNETKWEKIGGNPNDYNGNSAEKQHFAFINIDNIITGGGNVLNGTGENYTSAAEKFAIIGQHESGHSKFRFHPDNENDWGKTGYGVSGHVPGTIMKQKPQPGDVYDPYMIDRLKMLHNKDYKPLAPFTPFGH